MDQDLRHNPLLQVSSLPHQLPDFAAIEHAHYLPAFEYALKAQQEEIAAICAEPEITWENTVEAWEKSGRDLERVASIFFNLYGTDADDEMEAIAAEVAPQLAAHTDSIFLNSQLYERIKAVQAPADAESQRLHEHLLRQFQRHGAELDDSQRELLKEMNERLSVLEEEFGKNLREDSQALGVVVDDEQALAGWSADRIATAKKAAEEAGKSGYLIPLELPTVQSALSELRDPHTRQKLYEHSQLRGKQSNAEVVVEIATLRAKKAELLGFASHADYVIAEETAKESSAASQLLLDLAPAAATNASHEHKLLEEAAKAPVSGADWPYWESVLKREEYSVDETKLSEYFPLEQVLQDGVFYAAKRLYGIEVVPRDDLQGYGQDVQVWEVKEEDGSSIGLFLTDYYARPSKRGGAWMSSFVDQSDLLGTKPVIVNVMNITKPPAGKSALLTLDEVRTLFHEFGHALHGLLSNVRYPTFSGTNVPRDYVEFPSQINENWALDPAVVANYARHYESGELIPDQLLAAVARARTFGQGFSTVEFLAAAVLDLAWHSLSSVELAEITSDDIEDFERRVLEDAGLAVDGVAPRYRSTYFNHVFGGGYSARYYSYLWAEVLDADGFDWFVETHAAGEEFSESAVRASGQRFRDLVLSRGGADDFTTAFETLRGRAKDIAPLLSRRGLEGVDAG